MCVCVCVFFSRRRPHLPKSWALRWVDQQLHTKQILKVYFLLIMKFFLDSDWCAIILCRPCSSCYGNLAVVMVSLFSQLSVMTHSARSAPNIAYRCYLLNFEKPLGKLRSWAWFQAFLCRLGAHQVAWLKSLLIIFIALGDDTVYLPFTAHWNAL